MTSRRLALVIGNSNYMAAPRLHNARNDAVAVAAALKNLSFRVFDGFDLNRDDTEDLREKFETELENVDVALFYFAGHGLQLRGENFLLPIDADIKREGHLFTRTLNLTHQLNAMAQRATSSLLFIDACRENPFPAIARSTASSARGFLPRTGLAEVSANGSLIAFATSPNDVAADDVAGDDDGHSPFTQALLRHIEQPGLSIGDLMLKVRQDVHKSTNGRQIPWDHNSLLATFYFNPSRGQEELIQSEDTKDTTPVATTSVLRGTELNSNVAKKPEPPVRFAFAVAAILVVAVAVIVLTLDWYKPDWTCQIADRKACHPGSRSAEAFVSDAKLRIPASEDVERIRSSVASMEDRRQLTAVRDRYPQLAADVDARIAVLNARDGEIDAVRKSIPSQEDRIRLAAIRERFPQLAGDVDRRIDALNARDAEVSRLQTSIASLEDRNQLASLRERNPQLADDVDRRIAALDAKDAEIKRVRVSIASIEDRGRLATIRNRYPQLLDDVERQTTALNAKELEQARKSIASLDSRPALMNIRQKYPSLKNEVDRRLGDLDGAPSQPVGFVIYGVIDSHINMRRPFFSIPGDSARKELPQPDSVVECICKTGDFNLRPVPVHYDFSAGETRPRANDLQSVARIMAGGKARLNGDMYLTLDAGNRQWNLIAPVESVDGQNLQPLSAPFNPVLRTAEVLGYVYLGKIDGALLSDQRFSNETNAEAIFPGPGDRITSLKETGLYREPSRWNYASKTYTSEKPLRKLAPGMGLTVVGDLILSRKNTTVWAPVRKD